MNQMSSYLPKKDIMRSPAGSKKVDHFFTPVHPFIVAPLYIDNIYANQWFLVMNIIFGIFVSYLVGTVFYVLVEAPMSVLSQVFMKFLVGKTK